MKVILEKGGKEVSYKAGPALYLLSALIPLLGWILTLVFKQFKGVSLNQYILYIIFSVIAKVALSIFGNGFIYGIIALVLSILSIVVLVVYILNANYYSIKARIDEGYTVTNMNEPAVQLAVSKAESINTPFWQILKF